MPGTFEPMEDITGVIESNFDISGTLNKPADISGGLDYGTVEIITKDYNEVLNKPQINGVELIGNKSSEDLDLLDNREELSIQDINEAWKAIFG